MYDQSFIIDNLKSVAKASLRKEELKKGTLDTDAIYKRAVAFANVYGVSPAYKLPPEPKKPAKNKKKIFVMQNVCEEIVYKKVGLNIFTRTERRKRQRDFILNNCMAHLKDRAKFKLYRRDIKDFYGTIDREDLLGRLSGDVCLSKKTYQIVRNFFKAFECEISTGIPRGAYLSAVLSEFSMCAFDAYMREHSQVFLYERYVDDIIVVADDLLDEKKFWSEAEEVLPKGVLFHSTSDKCSTLNFPNDNGKGISFLGYKIYPLGTPSSEKNSRDIHVDMSEKKKNRFKTKIIKSFMSYNIDKNFDLLVQRIKLLTSNYYVYNSYKDVHMANGIYCGSMFLDVKSPNLGDALVELDAFLKNTLLSGKGKIGNKLKTNLTNKQRKIILSYSFKRGFDKKIFYNYAPDEYQKISECWQYV